MSKNSYTAADISIMNDIEHVRARPQMYIGSLTDTGLHHMVQEILSNSSDEAMNGYGSEILVTINPNESITIKDFGRGLPTDIEPTTGLPAAEVLMGHLKASGKFGKDNYEFSSGLNGVGASAVNALSEVFEVEVRRDNSLYKQRFEKGLKVTEFKKVDKCDGSGTTITFIPDKEVFKDRNTVFNYNNVLERCEETAYLNSKISIEVTDTRPKTPLVNKFHFPNGLIDMYNNKTKSLQHITKEPISVEGTHLDVPIDLVFGYVSLFADTVAAFVNGVRMPRGGTHVKGFKAALSRAINVSGREMGLIKEKDDNFKSDEVIEGLYLIISCRVKEPDFEGQTKNQINNPEAEKAAYAITLSYLKDYFDDNPAETQRIINKLFINRKLKEAQKNAKDQILGKISKDILNNITTKLADCSGNKPELNELFITEGDSASGSLKQMRDRITQAVLGIKGKILNVEKSTMDKILQNAEIRSIIQSIGAGLGDTFDINNIRYHKVIIAADSDSD